MGDKSVDRAAMEKAPQQMESKRQEIHQLRAELAARLGYEIVSQHTLIRARKIAQPR